MWKINPDKSTEILYNPLDLKYWSCCQLGYKSLVSYLIFSLRKAEINYMVGRHFLTWKPWGSLRICPEFSKVRDVVPQWQLNLVLTLMVRALLFLWHCTPLSSNGNSLSGSNYVGEADPHYITFFPDKTILGTHSKFLPKAIITFYFVQPVNLPAFFPNPLSSWTEILLHL